MTWYKETSQIQLDYCKPIMAANQQNEYLLLPHTNAEDYEVKGYDWFSLTTGCWNSSVCWRTPEAAVADYSRGHTIKNVVLSIEPIHYG